MTDNGNNSSNIQQRTLPGQGKVKCCFQSGRAVLVEQEASYPLRFLEPALTFGPDTSSDRRALYLLSYGGGLVSGDELDIHIDVQARCRLSFMTPSATKVYKQKQKSHFKATLPLLSRKQTVHSSGQSNVPRFLRGLSCAGGSRDKVRPILQYIQSDVGEKALLGFVMHPVICFEDSNYVQCHQFRLSSRTSSLLVIDGLTSGRVSRGEKWKFQHYHSITQVLLENECIFHDGLCLADGYQSSVEPYQCYQNIMLFGPAFREISKRIVHEVEQQPIYLKRTSGGMSQSRYQQGGNNRDAYESGSSMDRLLTSASYFYKDEGLIVRIAGEDTEEVKMRTLELVKGVDQVLGHDILSKLY
jgi:urease accessory protein